MSAIVKYTLVRLGIFVVLLAVLLPVPYPENILVKALIALFASAGLSFVLLGRWRNEMAEQLAAAAERRRAEKHRLRSALAGDEPAAADGDRDAGSAAETGRKPVDGAA
jgi:hypothetical protein